MKLSSSLLCLLLILPAQSTAGDQVLALKGQVVMRDTKLLLQDIIDTDSSDAKLVAEYGKIEVISEGEDITKIDQSRIHGLLIKAGANIDEIAFKIPKSILIERGMEFDLDSEKSAQIKKSITQKFKVPAANIDIGTARILPKLSEQEITYARFDSVQPVDLSHLNLSSFRVAIRGDDGLSRTYMLYVPLTIETKVLVASKDFHEGEVLSKDGYTEVNQKFSSLHEPILTLDDLKEGSPKATTDISKEEILLGRMVRPAILVKAGSTVTLSYKSAMLKVKTQGKMKDEGVIGDLVRVENVDSQQVVTGKLVSKDVVEVASAN